MISKNRNKTSERVSKLGSIIDGGHIMILAPQVKQ